jgi:hypothetical protein
VGAVPQVASDWQAAVHTGEPDWELCAFSQM